MLVLTLFKAGQIFYNIRKNFNRKMPPIAVTSYTVKKSSWNQYLHSVGTINPIFGTTLSAELAGRISKINFDSGAYVQKGAVLVEIDSEIEKAELKGALAKLELDKINAERQRTLRKNSANSKSDLDTAEANLLNSESEVERLKATIAKKTIVAPFDGKTGIRLVNLGETVAVGANIVTINNYDKLYINFSLPEKDFSKIKAGYDVIITSDSLEGEFVGKLTALESQIDFNTRNINIQATMDNKDKKLSPGMFVNVKVKLPEKKEVFAIPISSILFAPYGNSVYLIEASEENLKPVKSQIVKLGEERGDFVEIQSGLKENQTIVSTGAFKIIPNSLVDIQEIESLNPELYPNPENS